MHGSYDSTYKLQPGDVFMQLTGGVCEKLDVGDNADKANVLFDQLTNAYMSGCYISAVVPVS